MVPQIRPAVPGMIVSFTHSDLFTELALEARFRVSYPVPGEGRGVTGTLSGGARAVHLGAGRIGIGTASP